MPRVFIDTEVVFQFVFKEYQHTCESDVEKIVLSLNNHENKISPDKPLLSSYTYEDEKKDDEEEIEENSSYIYNFLKSFQKNARDYDLSLLMHSETWDV